MDTNNSNKAGQRGFLQRMMRSKYSLAMLAVSLALVLVAVVIVLLARSCDNNSVSLDTDDRIDITPSQIKSIEDIGQWELLSVSDEELVDTVRHGFFGDDELVRIYYGSVSLGIDLHDAKPGWISRQGDSIVVKLPPVKILDNNFIDEARTKSFVESGRWTAADREALYRRAEARMRERCLSESNLRSARENGSRQFYKLLRAMGFENVIIRY